MYEGMVKVRGSISGLGIQTTGGSSAGRLEETEAELLNEVGIGIGASINELLVVK